MMDVNEILYLVTAEGFRGRGVARSLVRLAVDATKHRHRCGVLVDAWDKNKAVRNLLEAEAFLIDPYNQKRKRRGKNPTFITYSLGKIPLEQRQT